MSDVKKIWWEKFDLKKKEGKQGERLPKSMKSEEFWRRSQGNWRPRL